MADLQAKSQPEPILPSHVRAWRACAPGRVPALLCVLCAVLLCAPIPASAASDPAEPERAELEQTRRRQQQIDSSVDLLRADVDQLERLVAGLEAELEVAARATELLRASVETATRRAAEADESYQEAVEELTRAVDSFEKSVPSMLVRPHVMDAATATGLQDPLERASDVALSAHVVRHRSAVLTAAEQARAERFQAWIAAGRAARAADVLASLAEAHAAEVAEQRAEAQAARAALDRRISAMIAEMDALAAAEDRLLDAIAAKQAQVRAARVPTSAPQSLLWPARGPVSSRFGPRWGRFHFGIDIANATGTPIRAAASGLVVHAGALGSFGMTVAIDHGGGITSISAHMSDVAVAEDELVVAGQRIGSMGSTGRSTGPHLHFEVRREGVAFDPMGLLS